MTDKVDLAERFYEPGLMHRSSRITPEIPASEEKSVHLSHLEYRVRRNPWDLLAHVQRFSLYRDQGEFQACFDVLVDLFLVLGSRGLPLRKRLFAQIEADLSEEQRKLLRAHMESGLQSTDVLPVMSRSCLSLGISGAVDLVTPDKGGGKNGLDSLDFARQCLAMGKYELAQVLLERRLDEAPGDIDTSMQLLQLYRERGLFQDFMLSYIKYAGRHLAGLESWRQADQSFRDEDVS